MYSVFQNEVGFSVQVYMNMFSFGWTVPTLIIFYYHYYYYLILHYFPLGWASGITGLNDNPQLKCPRAAASALPPSVNSDPGSHIPGYSGCPCATKQAGAVQSPRRRYFCQGKMGCHLEVPPFSIDDKILDNLDT